MPGEHTLTLNSDELDVLEHALTDAGNYRTEGADGESCADCGGPDDLCEDHAGDQDLGDKYAELLDRVRTAREET